MNERRREPRSEIKERIKIIDCEYDEKIGNLVDISPRGIRIKGNNPVETHERFQLKIVLNNKILGESEIVVYATCLWTREGDGPSPWLSGFEFYEVSQKASSTIIGFILEQNQLNTHK